MDPRLRMDPQAEPAYQEYLRNAQAQTEDQIPSAYVPVPPPEALPQDYSFQRDAPPHLGVRPLPRPNFPAGPLPGPNPPVGLAPPGVPSPPMPPIWEGMTLK